ncbi:MAG: hypothetical protein ACYCUT_10260, partial [bacterium]
MKNEKGKNWKKKKTPPAYQLSKFKGGRKVKVFKKFFHFGLCELRRQRIKNWEKKFKWGDLTVTMQAPESLNMYDKGILLAILVLFSEKAGELKIDEIVNPEFAAKPEELKIEEKMIEMINRIKKLHPGKYNAFSLASVAIDFDKFCKDYAGVSRAGRQNVLDSIKRWLSTKMFSQKGKEFQTFHFVVDLIINKNNIATFTISRRLLDSCGDGLFLAYDTFQSIKTEIGKMLYLFLLGNTNTVFSYTSLKNALGLTDKDDNNRELIKQGLSALQEKKILLSFKIENRTNDTYYLVIYGRLLKESQEKQPFTDINIIKVADYRASLESVNDGGESVNDAGES